MLPMISAIDRGQHRPEHHPEPGVPADALGGEGHRVGADAEVRHVSRLS